MIDLGLIGHGPEIQKRPISRAYLRLRNALVSGEPLVALEVVYLIPGSLGGADFDGFQISRRRGRDGRLVVYVAVPAAVAEADDPLEALVDLAQYAIEYVHVHGSDRDRKSVDFDAILARLTKVATSLLGPDYAPDAADPAVGPQQSGSGYDHQNEEASAVVILTVDDDRSALDAAFSLEEELEERLRDSRSGYVDGNQIGQGQYEILAYGPALDALREVIEPFVREHWPRPGATICLLDNGEEVATLRL